MKNMMDDHVKLGWMDAVVYNLRNRWRRGKSIEIEGEISKETFLLTNYEGLCIYSLLYLFLY